MSMVLEVRSVGSDLWPSGVCGAVLLVWHHRCSRQRHRASPATHDWCAASAMAGAHAHDDQSGQRLTLANFLVTDLTTDATAAYSWSNVAPTYSQNNDCNTGALHPLCVSYGDASGPNGGSFTMVVGAPGLQAGSFYSEHRWRDDRLGRRRLLW